MFDFFISNNYDGASNNLARALKCHFKINILDFVTNTIYTYTYVILDYY
jgi:hypothetical protein